MNEVLVGIGSGLVGWYLSQFSMLASENAAVINGYIKEVEVCSKSVEEYWLVKPESKEEEQKLAANVRARFAALAVFYGEAPAYLRTKHLRKYHMLQVQFLNTSTSGDFEGYSRKVDPERAIDAHLLSRKIVQVLRLARREQLSPPHWPALGWLRLKRLIDSW